MTNVTPLRIWKFRRNLCDISLSAFCLDGWVDICKDVKKPVGQTGGGRCEPYVITLDAKMMMEYHVLII